MTMKRDPVVLLAATAKGGLHIRELMGHTVEFVHAQSLEEVVAELRAAHFDLAIVSYHFDEMRPYRVIQEIRQQAKGISLPIILVTAMQVDLGQTSIDDIRSAYMGLGANDVLSLYEEEQRGGQVAARDLLRKAVSSHLR